MVVWWNCLANLNALIYNKAIFKIFVQNILAEYLQWKFDPLKTQENCQVTTLKKPLKRMTTHFITVYCKFVFSCRVDQKKEAGIKSTNLIGSLIVIAN